MSKTEWEPIVSGGKPRSHFVVATGTYSPIMMRKRDASGNWAYRAPTEAEIQEYIENEAW